MSDFTLNTAERVEDLMPRVMRRLFPFLPEDPLADMPVGQLRMLRMISDGHTSPSEISHVTGLTASAVTQMVNRLENAGMVARVEDQDDRRHRRLQLSDEGAKMVRFRQGLRVQSAVRALDALSAEDQSHLLRLLDLVATSGPPDRSDREWESISG